MSYSSQDWNVFRAAAEFIKGVLPIDVLSTSIRSRSRSRSPRRRSRSRSRSPIRILNQARIVRPVRPVQPVVQEPMCEPNPPKIIQPYSERLVSYRAIQNYLDQVENPDEICALSESIFPCKKRIGSKSVYGMIYRLYSKSVQRQTRLSASGKARVGILPTDFTVKVMDESAENKDEAANAQEFSKLVEDNVIPNFVMCWSDHSCKDKCSFIDLDEMGKIEQLRQRLKWQDIKNGSCYMLFAELFHGDMNNFQIYLRDFSRLQRINIVFSFIAQIFIVATLLDQYKQTHNDLHGGNVLFKSYSDSPNTAFVYRFKKNTVSVRHQSHLFAMWDVAFLQARGQTDKLRQGVITGIFNDLFKLFNVMAYYFGQEIKSDGLMIPNPDRDDLISKIFRKLRKWCAEVHEYNIEAMENIQKKESLTIKAVFEEVLPPLMESLNLLDQWNKVVNIDAELTPEEVTHEFDLTKRF